MKKAIFVLTALVLAQTAKANVKGFSCVGTEPFFSVEVKGQSLRYAAPGEEYKTTVERRIDAMGMSPGYVSVYKNKKRDITISIVEGKCTDGMSDNEYSKHLVFVKGNTVLYGCCEPLAQDND